MLAAEFAQFLGLPMPTRLNQAELTNAVCGLLRDLRCELVCVDEIHNLNLATRAGAEVSDQLKYLAERLPVTFVYAGINLESNGLFAGTRGQQIAGRFVTIDTTPFAYDTSRQPSRVAGPDRHPGAPTAAPSHPGQLGRARQLPARADQRHDRQPYSSHPRWGHRSYRRRHRGVDQGGPGPGRARPCCRKRPTPPSALNRPICQTGWEMRPWEQPVRALPRSVRPFADETTGSYIARLAVANRISENMLVRSIACCSPYKLIKEPFSHDVLLNRAAAARLSTLAAIPLGHLHHALPALRRPAFDHPDNTHIPYAKTYLSNSIGPACPECVHRRGIRDRFQVFIELPVHPQICPQHPAWLSYTQARRPVDVSDLPELAVACRSYPRLRRRHGATWPELAIASQTLLGWLHSRTRKALTHRWEQREAIARAIEQTVPGTRLGHGLIVFPEAITLARLMTSMRHLHTPDHGLRDPYLRLQTITKALGLAGPWQINALDALAVWAYEPNRSAVARPHQLRRTVSHPSPRNDINSEKNLAPGFSSNLSLPWSGGSRYDNWIEKGHVHAAAGGALRHEDRHLSYLRRTVGARRRERRRGATPLLTPCAPPMLMSRRSTARAVAQIQAGTSSAVSLRLARHHHATMSAVRDWGVGETAVTRYTRLR